MEIVVKIKKMDKMTSQLYQHNDSSFKHGFNIHMYIKTCIQNVIWYEEKATEVTFSCTYSFIMIAF